MSAITIENDLVHYEVLGRGRPVIFVHGWLGSWRYWVPTMQQLSMKYRTYALDLWGFGDSGKDASRYDFKSQVQLLNDFMEKLGITKAALVGHSLGAAICLRYASQYPERAPRVALISTPLFDMGGLDDFPATAAAVPAPAPAPAVTAPSGPEPVTPTPATTAPATTAPAAPAAVPAPAAAPILASSSSTTANAAPALSAQPAPSGTPATPVGPAPAAATPAAAPDAATGGSVSVKSAPAAPQPTTPSPAPGNAAQPAPAVPPTNAAAPSANATATPTAPAPAAASQPANSNNSQMPASSNSAADTIPRNPFRGLGDTPEEILARLQARNTATTAGVSTSAPAQAAPVPPGAPALPTSIATPILTKPTGPLSTPVPSAPAVPGPAAKPAEANPLVSILTGIKPAALLSKHVERDAPDLDKLRAEVEKTDEAAVTKSAQSFVGVNLAIELHKLASPTLLLHGKDDPLLPAPSDELIMRIAKGKSAGHLLAFVEPDLRHFPMLEITAKFNRLLMDFLDAQDLSNVQFKDQWRRTMR
jgi:pimeloyl-ACP methyl ester carboxylesterase